MGWEDRNGRRYYYRKRREGKRVVSEYMGSGFVGELAGNMDIVNRSESHQSRALWLNQKGSVEVIDEQISEVERFTKAITRAVLLVSGYHPHKRQWRKRRNV